MGRVSNTHWRAAPHYIACGDGSVVEEFRSGQREPEILVDSLEGVSSAKTKQGTGRISKI